MLNDSNKKKLGEYIDKLIDKLSSDAKDNIQKGMSNKQVIDKLINATVNTLTPQSKFLLSSTYNMMRDQTLANPLYKNDHNKAAFNKMNIDKELSSKFNFDIPKNINYEESEKEVNKWVKMGAVVVGGGVISISLGSYIPIGIAVVIAGIMSPLLKDRRGKDNTNLNFLVEEYLKNVKKSLWSWIESIEDYYDKKVEALQGKLG